MTKNNEVIKMARLCWKDMIEKAPNHMVPLLNEMMDYNIPLKAKVKLRSKVESVVDEVEGLYIDAVDLLVDDCKLEVVCICSEEGIMLMSCMNRMDKGPESIYGRIAHFILLEDESEWSPDANDNNVRINAKGVLDYSTNELLEKRLWCLVPFVLLHVVREKASFERYYALRAEVANLMTEMLSTLKTDMQAGMIDDFTSNVILSQCITILEHLTQ